MKNKKSILFSTFLTYFICLMFFVLIRILVLIVKLPFDTAIVSNLSTLFVQIGIMFILPIFLFSYFQKQKYTKTLQDFKFNKINLYSIGLCVLIGFLCYFLNLAIASFFGSIIKFLGFETAPSMAKTTTSNDVSFSAFIVEVISVALLPAICEETAHRGLLFYGSSSLGIKSSVIISSFLFGLMHLNINQFFYATILGFIIAMSVLISKSIIPAIIIHFMNNFLNTYFSFAVANNWFGIKIYKFANSFLYSSNVISYFFTSFFALTILLLAIVFLFSLLLRETRIKNVKNMLKDISEINKEFNAGNEIYTENANISNLHALNQLMEEYNIKTLNSMIFTDAEKKKIKPSKIELALIISCFVVGGLVTSFTFIWGLL